VPAVRMFGNVV